MKTKANILNKKFIWVIVAFVLAFMLVPAAAFAADDSAWIKEGNDGSQYEKTTSDAGKSGQATSHIDAYVSADSVEIIHRLSVGFDWTDQNMNYSLTKLTKTWNTRTLQWEVSTEGGSWKSDTAQALIRNRSSLPVSAWAEATATSGINITSDTTATNAITLDSALSGVEKSGTIKFTGQPSSPSSIGLVKVPVIFHVNQKTAPSHTLTLTQMEGIQFTAATGTETLPTISSLTVADGDVGKFKINLSDSTKAIDTVNYVSEDGTSCILVKGTNDVYTTPQMTSDATINVTLKNVPSVQSIGLDQSKINLSASSNAITADLKAYLYPASAKSGKTVKWTTSDSKVATVAASPTDSTVATVSKADTCKGGVATITASVDGKTAECEVTVGTGTVPVESVTLTAPSSGSIEIDPTKTTTVQVTVNPSDAANKTVNWESSNPDVANVASASTSPATGATTTDVVVTGYTGGQTTITATTVDGNKQVSCTIKVKPTVKYDANGVTLKTGSSLPDPVAVSLGGTIATAPTAPEADNYTFKGWYTEPECKTAFVFDVAGTGTAVNADMTLYAKWKSTANTVTLDSGAHPATGSTPTPNKVEDVKNGQAMPALVVGQLLTGAAGYVFDGYADTDGNKYYDSLGNSVKNWDKSIDTTLTAIWKNKTQKIILDPCEGTGISPTSLTDSGTYPIVYGSKLTDISGFSAPSRTGYTFGGLYDVPNPGTDATQYFDADGKATASVWNKDYEEYTLYAKWTAKTSNVTLNANGGSTTKTSVTATYDADMTQLESTELPTRSGYTFKGYNSASDGKGTYYYDETGASAHVWDKESDSTLYAIWEAKTVNIKYLDQNGAVFSGNHVSGYPETHTNGSDTQINETPTKAGYTFKGYWADMECAITQVTVISGSTGYDSDITLYAKWE